MDDKVKKTATRKSTTTKKKTSKKEEPAVELVEQVIEVQQKPLSMSEMLEEKIASAVQFKVLLRGKQIGDSATTRIKVLEDGIVVGKTKYPFKGIEIKL